MVLGRVLTIATMEMTTATKARKAPITTAATDGQLISPAPWKITSNTRIEARKAYEPAPRSAQARATMTIPAQSARERRGSGNVVTAVPGASRADMSGAALTSSSEPVT